MHFHVHDIIISNCTQCHDQHVWGTDLHTSIAELHYNAMLQLKIKVCHRNAYSRTLNYSFVRYLVSHLVLSCESIVMFRVRVLSIHKPILSLLCHYTWHVIIVFVGYPVLVQSANLIRFWFISCWDLNIVLRKVAEHNNGPLPYVLLYINFYF